MNSILRRHRVGSGSNPGPPVAVRGSLTISTGTSVSISKRAQIAVIIVVTLIATLIPTAAEANGQARVSGTNVEIALLGFDPDEANAALDLAQTEEFVGLADSMRDLRILADPGVEGSPLVQTDVSIDKTGRAGSLMIWTVSPAGVTTQVASGRWSGADMSGAQLTMQYFDEEGRVVHEETGHNEDLAYSGPEDEACEDACEAVATGAGVGISAAALAAGIIPAIACNVACAVGFFIVGTAIALGSGTLCEADDGLICSRAAAAGQPELSISCSYPTHCNFDIRIVDESEQSNYLSSYVTRLEWKTAPGALRTHVADFDTGEHNGSYTFFSSGDKFYFAAQLTGRADYPSWKNSCDPTIVEGYTLITKYSGDQVADGSVVTWPRTVNCVL